VRGEGFRESRPFVRVSEGGELLPETHEVLALIAAHGLTLATGHVTPAEALMILDEARRLGTERMIVTHPLLGEQYTFMSDDELVRAVELGGVVEMTAGTLYGEGPAQQRAVNVIRMLGSENVLVGSDSGLIGTPNHPDALVMAARALRTAGFSEHDLDLMFRINPARLIGLDDR
jgi:predicted metal-dependent TIM-barrel fold hydrolase